MYGLKGIMPDTYTIQARLLPGLLVICPAVLAALSWAPTSASLSIAVSVVLTVIGVPLLSQLSRDRGRILQEKLFREWGGAPSVALLRHRDPTINALVKRSYIQKAGSIFPDIQFPTPEEEELRPLEADQKYAALCEVLKERTKDNTRFPLVFAENMNYGYRRNLAAMKDVGIVFAIVGILLSAGAVLYLELTGGDISAAIVAAVCSTSLLVWWFLRISADWVRLAATAYAERLLGAMNEIVPSSTVISAPPK